jgi:hypothetical protein
MVPPPLRKVSHSKVKKFHVLYPFILPPRRPLALSRKRILILEFIRSPPTLAVYEVVHSLPLGVSG